MARIFFDHEKLDVYQESIAFVAWLTPILESVTKSGDVRDQLDRASTSIPLNIAEGNGRYTSKDRSRFLDTAYGSALECAASLDALVAKKKLELSLAESGKELLSRIVRMLMGLQQSLGQRNYKKDTE